MNKPPDQNADVAPQFAFFNEIGIISQLSSALFERNLPAGLTNSQFSVLNWFLRVDTEATPGRLATAFQVTAGAMTNTLKKLEAKELVKIEPDASSGRKKRVTITAKGEAMREQAIASAAPFFEEFAREFPVAKLEKQLEDLKQIRQYLDKRRYN
jgi:DNA-binding MarR family transcriptional regulator